MTAKRILLAAALVILALVVVRALLFSKEPAPQVRTVPVQQGTVRTAVTGAGTVEPVSQQNLSFTQEGQLVEVNVKVGDRVRAGQVLAKIDPSGSSSALKDAVGSLQQARATLRNARQQNAVETAAHALAAAEQALNDVKKQVSKTINAGEDLVSSDKRQLSFDKKILDRDQDKLDRDEAVLRRDRATLREAQESFRAHWCDKPVPPNPVRCMADRKAVEQAQSAVDASKSKVAQSKEKMLASKAKVLASEAKLSADEHQLAVDRANGQKSINDAEAEVTSAWDTLRSERVSRPNTIAEQQGGVTSAQAQVDTALKNLDETTLVTPVDGTVVSVNGRVGETVTAGGGTTPLAPGSSAPQPSTATAVTPAAQSGGNGQAASPFIVLANVRSFEVVVPLAEADAAQVQPGQKAYATFDALPEVTLPAKVAAVAPGSTVIQNVTNYFVTLSLDQLDPRLRAGLTANAEIVVTEVRDVVVVPNAAIQRIGGQAFVSVLQEDGKTQRRVLVQTGAEGDMTTEVTEGLEPGDKVVLPTVRAPNGQPPRGGGPSG